MRARFLIIALALTSLAGLPGAAAGAVVARGFVEPVDAVREASGSILVADPGDHRIKRIAPGGEVTTVAGSGSTTEGGFAGDGGPATAARLNAPQGVSPLPGGGFLIADTMNARVRRVAPDGTISTVAGGGIMGHRCPARALGPGAVQSVTAAGDGGFAFAGQGAVYTVAPDGSTRVLALGSAADIAWDLHGDLLFAGGEANMAWRVAKDGSSITHIAGRGPAGMDGDGGSATNALYDDLRSITGATWGDAYVADRDNHRIRIISSAGGTSTVAGSGSGFGDEYPWDFRMTSPSGIEMDPLGGMLIADTGNRMVRRLGGDDTSIDPPAAIPSGPNDACRSLDYAYGHYGVSLSDRHRGTSYSYLSPPTGFDLDPEGRAAATTVYAKGSWTGLAVRRVGPDGEPDHADDFLPLTQSTGGAIVGPRGLARMPDGGYVAAAGAQLGGRGDHELVLGGFEADGTLDHDFGTDGRVVALTDAGGVAGGGGVVLATPGSTVTLLGAKDYELKVMRYERDGDPDLGFGEGGVVSHLTSEVGGPPTAGLALPGGSILVAVGPRVTKLRPDGSIDPSWAGDGTALLPETPIVQGMMLEPDGSVVLATRLEAAGAEGLVMKLRPDGTLDPAFGEGGVVRLLADARDVARRADGRLVVAGQGREPWGHGPTIYGLLADGRPDTSVGPEGRQVTPMLSGGLYEHVGLLPDGRVIASALLYHYEFQAFARYAFGGPGPGAPTDPVPGDGAPVTGTAPAPAPAAALDAGPPAGRSDVRDRPDPVIGARALATSLRSLLRRGLRVRLTARGPGTARVRLLLGRRLVARRTLRFWAAGTRTVTLPVRGRRVRAAVRRRPRLLRVVLDVDGRRVSSVPLRLR